MIEVTTAVENYFVDFLFFCFLGDDFTHFGGGFAAGLVKFKRNVFEAAHYANAVAALSVTRHGTADSMPTAREITRFLRRRDHK